MKKKIKAFTLVELMVVLAIVGILVLLALPNLMPLISKTKSTGSKNSFGAYIQFRKKVISTCIRLNSDDLTAIGYQQEKSVLEGGNANYRIEIVEAAPTGFTAHAIAVVDFDGDGAIQYLVNGSGQTVT